LLGEDVVAALSAGLAVGGPFGRALPDGDCRGRRRHRPGGARQSRQSARRRAVDPGRAARGRRPGGPPARALAATCSTACGSSRASIC
jgi:hypothetical protein